jgi:hypothetical protein
MATQLTNQAVLHNGDPIGVVSSVKSVGNSDDGAPFEHCIEGSFEVTGGSWI